MDPEHRAALFERVERATQVPMLILAVLFLVAIAIPEVVDLDQAATDTLEAVTWLIWALFAFELAAKTALAPDRRRYLATHWMDLLTVLVPFLRPLRVLAVVAAGLRFWVEARTVLRRRALSLIAVTGTASVLLSAGAIYLAERRGEGPIQTIEDAVWWALVTITTVGYGDMYPKTPFGRGVAVILMLVGITLFGLLTARVAAYFVEADEEQAGGVSQKLDEVLARLERLERAMADPQVGVSSVSSVSDSRAAAGPPAPPAGPGAARP